MGRSGVTKIRGALSWPLASVLAIGIGGAAAAEAENCVMGPGAAAIALAGMIFVLLFTLYRLTAYRRRMLYAHSRLAVLTQDLKAGEITNWVETGIADVDAIAATLQDFDRRLREKRSKLARLNEELIKREPIAGSTGFNNELRAIINAMPVGVLIAEAPSGRILEGNRAIESILRHPVIYSDNADAYSQWIAAHENGAPVQPSEFPLARALAGEEHPTLECRYRRGDGSWGWIDIVGAPIRSDRNEIIGAIAAITDIDGIKAAEERGRMMIMELHHRVNNALAMIQGIANITSRSATNLDCFRSNFSNRIHCLSRISTLLVSKSWTCTPVRELVATVFACESADYGDRISFSGEDVELRSEVALALGMALHELLSNAVRYGALSTDKGKVTVDWRVVDGEKRHLALKWTESGGPSVEAPDRVGVGQILMKNILARQFGGDVEIHFETEGVRADITAEI